MPPDKPNNQKQLECGFNHKWGCKCYQKPMTNHNKGGAVKPTEGWREEEEKLWKEYYTKNFPENYLMNGEKKWFQLDTETTMKYWLERIARAREALLQEIYSRQQKKLRELAKTQLIVDVSEIGIVQEYALEHDIKLQDNE